MRVSTGGEYCYDRTAEYFNEPNEFAYEGSDDEEKEGESMFRESLQARQDREAAEKKKGGGARPTQDQGRRGEEAEAEEQEKEEKEEKEKEKERQ